MVSVMDWQGFFSGLAGAFVIAVPVVATWLIKLIGQRKEWQKSEKKDLVDELYKLLDRQKQDHDEDRQLIHDQRGDIQKLMLEGQLCKRRGKALHARIEELTEAMTKAGISVPPWEGFSEDES